MTWRAIALLGRRMARRNYLYLFAWLCAIAVPAGLQLAAGTIEDIRTWLSYYYGPVSLYMFFAMTYGFGTVFVAYYQVGAFRRTGSLDSLRVAQVSPGQVVAGVFYQLEHILLVPQLAFMAGFGVYAMLFAGDSFISDLRWYEFTFFALVIVLNQMLLAAIQATALFRREESAALINALLVLPLNTGVVIVSFILGLPAWAYVLVQAGIVLGLLALARQRVAALWPPQRREHG